MNGYDGVGVTTVGASMFASNTAGHGGTFFFYVIWFIGFDCFAPRTDHRFFTS